MLSALISVICLSSDMSLSQVSALVLAICLSSNMSASQITFLVSFICLPSDMSLSQVSALVFAICLSSNMSASQISSLVSFICLPSDKSCKLRLRLPRLQCKYVGSSFNSRPAPPSIAVDNFLKAYPMIPLSCRSNLAVRYL
jgi:hypothetical protein